jgi:hypothetical protein
MDREQGNLTTLSKQKANTFEKRQRTLIVRLCWLGAGKHSRGPAAILTQHFWGFLRVYYAGATAGNTKWGSGCKRSVENAARQFMELYHETSLADQRTSLCAAANQSVSGQFTLTNQRTSSLQRNRECSNGVEGGRGGTEVAVPQKFN